MISNAFKNAYMSEQSAINQVGANVTNAMKGAGTLIAGIAGFTGTLGDSAVATAAKHNLAGQVGGIGGNIMLATMDEKKAASQSQQIQNFAKLSEEELDARFEPIAKGVDPNSLEEQVVDTVWNKIQKERAKNLEKNLLNKLNLQTFSGNDEEIEIEEKIKNKYGKTYDFREAGYFTAKGDMIDLSGRREGASGGSRQVDHRDVFSSDDRTEEMIKFMGRGNIRVSPEYPGINLQKEPTNEQYELIRKMADKLGWKEKYFAIDIDDEKGNNIETLNYENNISGKKVVEDLKYYFKEGKLPYKSKLSEFRGED